MDYLDNSVDIFRTLSYENIRHEDTPDYYPIEENIREFENILRNSLKDDEDQAIPTIDKLLDDIPSEFVDEGRGRGGVKKNGELFSESIF